MAVVVVASAGGVEPALGPRALQPSRPLHRGGTLTLASRRALHSRRQSPVRSAPITNPQVIRSVKTKQKKIPKNSCGCRTLKRPRVPNRRRRRSGTANLRSNRASWSAAGRSAPRARACSLMTVVAERCGGSAGVCACVAWVLCLCLCSLSLSLAFLYGSNVVCLLAVLRLPGRKPLRHGSQSLTPRVHGIGGPDAWADDKRVQRVVGPPVSGWVG
jgi:hypothetical protein